MNKFLINIFLTISLFSFSSKCMTYEERKERQQNIHKMIEEFSTIYDYRGKYIKNEKEKTEKFEYIPSEKFYLGNLVPGTPNKITYTTVEEGKITDDSFVQYKYYFGFKEEKHTKIVYTVYYTLNVNGDIDIGFSTCSVKGFLQISASTPFENEKKDEDDPDEKDEDIHLKFIYAFVKSTIKKSLFQFLDRLAQAIEEAHELKDHLETITKSLAKDKKLTIEKVEQFKSEELIEKIADTFVSEKPEKYYDKYINNDLFSDDKFDVEAKLTMLADWTELFKKDYPAIESDIMHELNHPENGLQKMDKATVYKNHSTLWYFELVYNEFNLKKFGPTEFLVTLYPLKMLMTIKAKSNFFQFETSVNILTVSFLSSTIISLVNRIKNNLYKNIESLHDSSMTPASSLNADGGTQSVYDSLLKTFKFEEMNESNKERQIIRPFSNLEPSKAFNCKRNGETGMTLCSNVINDVFKIIGLFHSYPLSEEDIKIGDEDNLSFEIEKLTTDARAMSSFFLTSFIEFNFPLKTMYNLDYYMKTFVRFLIINSDDFDCTLGGTVPKKITIKQQEKIYDINIGEGLDGNELIKYTVTEDEESVSLLDEGNNFDIDFSIFNIEGTIESPVCVGTCLTDDEARDSKEITNGLKVKYQLAFRENNDPSLPFVYWKPFLVQKMLSDRKKRVSII